MLFFFFVQKFVCWHQLAVICGCCFLSNVSCVPLKVVILKYIKVQYVINWSFMKTGVSQRRGIRGKVAVICKILPCLMFYVTILLLYTKWIFGLDFSHTVRIWYPSATVSYYNVLSSSNTINIIQICSGITRGRVLNGELSPEDLWVSHIIFN